ncbi:head GIN domain-containing protein [Cesiribacter andamanensis]|uniref:Putative auto-transporter adhesin head GIN domain-containing protein n=1 Tax=Cesiribacter andamanensis AMV16 TaxID=1279009 RepID=M7NZF8_9BACT|nr:head GIN domain-containing protein [Cesiribacter andamanensis]EMR03729.1 hypothetical protein ADICEAN_01163 [Cesiribacter andamanensis AMV16]
MKALLTIVLTLFVSFTLSAQGSQNRSVSSFTKLSIAVPADVRLSKGPFKVVLEGEDLDEIQTTVKGGELRIHRKDNNWSFWNWNSDNKLVVHISMPSLEGVSVSGSGKLVSQDQFHSDRMRIAVSGSGRVELRVASDHLSTHVSGSGSITLSGITDTLETHISGSGSVRADKLAAQQVEAHISGSGSCNVHVDKSIDARISGSGNIRYTGNPTTVNARTSGSGKVVKRG